MKRSLLALPGLCVLAACSSSGSSAPKPRGEPLVVPAGPGSYYLFKEGAVERRPAGTVQPLPSDAGRPAAAGVDPNGGWAAVAYERGLFAVQLAEGRVVPVADVEWSSPPGTIGVRGGLAGTAEDGTIGLYRVADGAREWRGNGHEILAEAGLKELFFVLPLSKQELIVVGFKGMDSLGYPDARVVVLDRSGGRPTLVREQPVRGMHWLRACASDGELVFLGGENERVVNLPGFKNQQLVQALLVVQVDPAKLATRELVREEMPGREIRVRQLAAGFGLVAVSLEGGELAVYRVKDGLATSAAYRNRYTTEVSAACLDETHVVVASGEQTTVVEVR